MRGSAGLRKKCQTRAFAGREGTWSVLGRTLGPTNGLCSRLDRPASGDWLKGHLSPGASPLNEVTSPALPPMRTESKQHPQNQGSVGHRDLVLPVLLQAGSLG